jgi:protease-4
MSNQKSGCFAGMLGVLLILSVILNVSFFASKSGKIQSAVKIGPRFPDFEERVVEVATPEAAGSERRIALIELNGVIGAEDGGDIEGLGYENLVQQLRRAREDQTVAGVLLKIDSPGGEVTASDILYDAVRKTREVKPVVVVMMSVAASGGYYVACGGSYLFAHDTTITASIGVIIQSLHYKELFEKLGLSMETFKSGKMKDMLNGARDLTDEERAYVQGLIAQSYDRFVGIVARERNLDEAALRNGVADGRIVSGTDAKREKLVDALGGVDPALLKVRELSNAPGAGLIRYESPFHFGKLARFLMESPLRGGRLQVDMGGGLKASPRRGRLYFLSPVLMP